MLDRTRLDTSDQGDTPAATVTMFPLDRLMLSGLNVRRTERDADIAALAEDIAARGLKQNLVVTPAHFSTGEDADEGNVDWAYQLEVIAGGRRFQALRLLANAGRIAADHPVPCLLEQRGEARETSLSENLHRVAMNPADEFEAFAAIVGQHENAGTPRAEAVTLCAKRFGKTEAYVDGRLRLAALAPEILEALRQDKIGIEAAKAYAAVSDHKLQLQVFKEREKDSWHGHKPATIRLRMRGKTIPLTDRRVVYVGLDAYLAAGGRTEVEMFMGAEGEERLIDPAKLDKLAREKAEAAIAELAAKGGFMEGLYAAPGQWDPSWPKPPKEMERAYSYYGTKTPTKKQLKKSVGVYAITRDGTGLELIGRFKPKGEVGSEDRGSYTPPTPEQIAAERRERGVATIAARLAVGKFAGTPLEGRTYWPSNGRWIDAITEIANDEVLVVVQVKVSKADIEAQQEAAAAKYDAELAEEEAERARLAAAAAEQDGATAEEAADELEDLDSEFAEDGADELAAN